MKKKLRGEITVEAAIVIPILILVVISLIYFALYVHDILVLKSYAYSAGIENINYKLDDFSNNVKTKINKAPALIITPKVKCYKKNDNYFIEIIGINTSKIRILDNLITGESMKIKIQKSIERDSMYIVRGIIDFVKE